MEQPPSPVREVETGVTVHYWAAARAAAGTGSDVFAVDGPVTLADVVRRVLAAHPGDRAARVVATCSVLVGDRPVGTRSPEDVVVRPGETVEFLPPFAGG
jgi:molybdopterin converting factor small subunit